MLCTPSDTTLPVAPHFVSQTLENEREAAKESDVSACMCIYGKQQKQCDASEMFFQPMLDPPCPKTFGRSPLAVASPIPEYHANDPGLLQDLFVQWCTPWSPPPGPTPSNTAPGPTPSNTAPHPSSRSPQTSKTTNSDTLLPKMLFVFLVFCVVMMAIARTGA